MTFNKSFSFTLYDQVYNAQVEGVIEYDEFDRNVTHSLIDTIILEDCDGNLVDESHDDYEDLINAVESRDYQPEMEW